MSINTYTNFASVDHNKPKLTGNDTRCQNKIVLSQRVKFSDDLVYLYWLSQRFFSAKYSCYTVHDSVYLNKI